MTSLLQNVSTFSVVSCNPSALLCESVFPNNINKTCLYSLFAGARRLIESKVIPYFDSYYTSNNSSTRCIEYNILSVGERSSSLDSNTYIDLLKIENLHKLDCMSDFKENWNGSGGVPFSAAAIHTFKEILEGLFKQPQIAPTGRNSLFMQYETTNHSVLAFEVKETQVEMACVPNGDYKAAVSKIFKDNFTEQMNLEVAHFYGSECD